MTDLTRPDAGAIWDRYAEQRATVRAAGDGELQSALTVRLSGHQAELLAQAAAREGRSRGAVIRRAIDAAIGDDAPVPSGLLEYVDVGAAADAYLRDQGVDVARSMAEAGAELAARDADDAIRARVRADSAFSLAFSLKAAERKLLFEARGFNSNAAGFTAAGLAEAQARVSALSAALDEACCHDPELVRQARRAAE